MIESMKPPYILQMEKRSFIKSKADLSPELSCAILSSRNTWPAGHQLRILRLPEVMAKTGLSRSTIYSRMQDCPGNKSFDPTFPRSFSLGGRARGWLEEDVDAWIANRTRLAGLLGKEGDRDE